MSTPQQRQATDRARWTAEWAATITEKAWMQHVTDLARWNGWHVHHEHDSRRSTPGVPDLLLVRGVRLVYAELKSAKGRLSGPQREWLGWLAKAGAETYVWKPSDLVEVTATLARTP